MRAFRYIFFLLFNLLLISNVSSKDIDYPRYEIDSLGQKVVVMTIEQAQALDNSTDLLVLFEKLGQQINDYDSICVKVINDKEIVITEQKLLISELKDRIDIKVKEIENLKNQIVEYQLRELMLNKKLDILTDKIDLKDGEINRLKTKSLIGGSIGGVVIVGLIVAILVFK